MLKNTSRRGQRGSLAVLLALIALITGGGTNPDCNDRAVVWGATNDYILHLLDQAGSETTDVTPVTTETRRARWYGDDQSRLIIYSWGSEHNGVNFSSLTTSAKSVRAIDRSWPMTMSADQYTNYTQWVVGQPCTGSTCGEWKSVTSLDIGFCSLNIPHAQRPPSRSSPFLNAAGLANISFPLDIIAQINEELDGGFFEGDGCLAGNCDIYTRLRSAYPVSHWVSTDNRKNELCFRIPFEARIDKGLSCPYHWVEASVCGYFDVEAQQQLTWVGTRSHWSRYTTPLSPTCNTARKRVAEQVIERLSRPSSHADGPNEITLALRSRFREFSLSAADIDPTGELSLIHQACNPTAPYGNLPCALEIGNALPTECVAVGTSGQGECRFYAPISRAEMLPSGVELVMLEQPKGSNNPIINLINDYDEPGTLLNDLKTHHCAAPDGSQTDTISRRHERITRVNQATLFPTPTNTSLD